MTDMHFQPGSDLAVALRAKQISSRELLDLYLDRIARLNATLNAVVTLDEERARKRALEADEALAAGEVWGPLHGLPVTVKDAYEVAGVRTTSGHADYDHISVTDADAVKRLRDAGAVVFGKTNMPSLGRDYQTSNEVFGQTNNPWDIERTPGGSSGGAAAALAAGLTGLELGSDIGGSARLPAHNCGVYGLKPSSRVIPGWGHISRSPGARLDMVMLEPGPMGRSADDLELSLDVLAAPKAADAGAWSVKIPPARHTSLEDYRIAAWLDDDFCPVDSEVGDAIGAAVDSLRSAGATVVETPGPISLRDSFYDYFLPVFVANGSELFSQEEFEGMVQLADLSPAEAEFLKDDPKTSRIDMLPLAKGLTMRVRDWNLLGERRLLAEEMWAEFFTDYDALLCPVSPVVATRHDPHPDWHQRIVSVNGQPTRFELPMMVWTMLANVFRLPAVAAPVGLGRSGLPVGIQVMGPYLEDRTAIDLARRLGYITGGYISPGGF